MLSPPCAHLKATALWRRVQGKGVRHGHEMFYIVRLTMTALAVLCYFVVQVVSSFLHFSNTYNIMGQEVSK